MSLKEGYQRPNQLVFKAPVKEKKSVVVNGIDLLENVPPRTENEVCGERLPKNHGSVAAHWLANQAGFTGLPPCFNILFYFIQNILHTFYMVDFVASRDVTIILWYCGDRSVSMSL